MSADVDILAIEGGYALRGAITEDADFSTVLARSTGAVALDLHGVKRITSPGVSLWVDFLRALAASGCRAELVRCSPVMAHQFTMIPSTTAGARVVSLEAPYWCRACDAEAQLPVELVGAPTIAETAPCPRCGSAMDFDGDRASWIAFAAREAAA